MSEKRTRRHFSAQEKVAALKRHLLEKVPISDLCDELDVYPNQIYGWLKEFFENGHAAFDNGRKSKAEEEAKHGPDKGTGYICADRCENDPSIGRLFRDRSRTWASSIQVL